jgi:hypothetical protein
MNTQGAIISSKDPAGMYGFTGDVKWKSMYFGRITAPLQHSRPRPSRKAAASTAASRTVTVSATRDRALRLFHWYL